VGICLGIVSVTTLVVSSRARRELGRLVDQYSDHRRLWPWLMIHVVSYYALFWSTGWLVNGLARAPHQALPVGLWVFCGLAALSSWALSAMPLGFWIQALRRGWTLLLTGTCVGVLALEMGGLTGGLWNSLHRLTIVAASSVLTLLGANVVCDPESLRLGMGDFVVLISSECSGFEGIGLIWTLLGAYLFLFRRELRFPQAFLLIPIGTGIIWLFNVLRIAGLVFIGATGHPRIALGGFHSQAGWLAFNIVGLGLVALSRRARWFSLVDRLDESGRSAATNHTAAYIVPLLAIVATAMVTGALTDGTFDRFYPARVAAALAALWFYRPILSAQRWNWAWSWAAVCIGVLVFLIWIALEPLPDSARVAAARAIPHALAEMSFLGAASWLAARLVGSVVTAPLAEELAFRGYLLRRFVAAEFQKVPLTRCTWSSLTLSSILFGAVHQRWLAGTIAGLLYALVVLRRGRLGDAVLSHATTNTLIAVYTITTGTWTLWA
jgi:exosortase E/protease (VPEID-CTERM system)